MISVDNPTSSFESELKYIIKIFSNLYSPEDIIKKSIQYKLNKSYEQYLIDVNSSINKLKIGNPEEILKKAVKE